MMEKNSEIFYEKRETNKISLEHYVLDKKNVLDFPIDKLIKDLGADLKKKKKESIIINETQLNSKHEEKIFFDFENVIEIISLEEEIKALLEVKIIFAFKHFEINLKKLIKAAYDDNNFSKNYKWEFIKQYLILKNIDIREFESYSNVNQLRELNNHIKHADNYLENDNLKKIIPELKKSSPSSRDLYMFYERVKKSPNEFLGSLSSKIYNDLYCFNDERLKKMADSFAIRMDEDQAEKFIEILRNNY